MSVSYSACVFYGIQIESIDYDNEPTDPTKTFGWVEVGSACYGGEQAFFLIASGSYISLGNHTKIFVSLEDTQEKFIGSPKSQDFLWGYMEYCNDNKLVPVGIADPQWYMAFSIS